MYGTSSLLVFSCRGQKCAKDMFMFKDYVLCISMKLALYQALSLDFIVLN